MSLLDCQKRALRLLMIFSCCFLLLGARLFCLQLLRSENLSLQAVRQRFQSAMLYDGRGDIQDRFGRSLLGGRQRLSLLAFPTHYRGCEEEIIRSFASLQGIDKIAAPPHETLPFWLDSDLNELQLAAASSYPGLLAAIRKERYGPGALASHLVGYMNESEGTGVSGIELAFDHTLSCGQQKIIGAVVDGRNRLISGLGYRKKEERLSPKNVLLSLDLDLQREVEKIMDRRIRKGAVVVIDPANGDILAMASRPNFKAAELASYLKETNGALINRALCAYQPGSVFKVVVAAAALEEGLASLFQIFHCPGGVTVDGLYFPCSNLHLKEEITFVEAFAHSCNSVFINLALELGPEKIAAYARRFGLGECCGLPLAEEEAGYIPLPEELFSRRAQANSAIGQGEVMVTPLQAAAMMAALANGGQKVQPRLVLGLTDRQGRDTARFWARRGSRILSPATVNKLKYLLQEVVARGTAQQAARTQSPAAAKTGTAESGRYGSDGRQILNYWIAGFYPLENARAAVAVFADELKEGTVKQVFGEIIYYLENKPLH
ncbi:MAG TPA: penicillin-binding protein 2 [Bacillota bacterium]|nr:penicillin-binding protein 2 [Bacillota bacterium]